jgi:hypothetical protein
MSGMADRTLRGGALLLEVVVAMAIMVVTLALMGAQLRNGLEMTYGADDRTHGAFLADRLLATIELDLEQQRAIFEDQQREGDFGPRFPGYYWELIIEPLDEDEVGVPLVDEETGAETLVAQMTIDIYYQRPLDGLYEEFGGSRPDEARLLHSVHMVRASPPQIDLAEDFGMTEEQITGVTELIPEIDPQNFNPQELLQMIAADPESFLGVLGSDQLGPLLQQLGLSDAGQLPQQLQEILSGGGGLGEAPAAAV